MSKARRRWWIRLVVWVAVILGLLAVPVVYVIEVLNHTESMVMHSCLASMNTALDSAEPEDLHLSAKLQNSWTVLDESDSNRVFQWLLSSRDNALDCSRHRWKPGGMPVDKWGERVQIAVRVSEEGRREFVLWSNGRDGIRGSEDDVISPYWEKAPE